MAYLDSGDVLGVTAHTSGSGSSDVEESSGNVSNDEGSDDSDDQTYSSSRLTGVLRRFRIRNSRWGRAELPWEGDAPASPLYTRDDYAIQD